MLSGRYGAFLFFNAGCGLVAMVASCLFHWGGLFGVEWTFSWSIVTWAALGYAAWMVLFSPIWFSILTRYQDDGPE